MKNPNSKTVFLYAFLLVPSQGNQTGFKKNLRTGTMHWSAGLAQ
jgi:hypothetical protein